MLYNKFNFFSTNLSMLRNSNIYTLYFTWWQYKEIQWTLMKQTWWNLRQDNFCLVFTRLQPWPKLNFTTSKIDNILIRLNPKNLTCCRQLFEIWNFLYTCTMLWTVVLMGTKMILYKSITNFWSKSWSMQRLYYIKLTPLLIFVSSRVI